MYYVFKIFIVLLLSFNFLACTAVFDVINSGSLTHDNFILTSNCSTRAPKNLSYYCKPTISNTSLNLTKNSLTPVFELINNTCSGLTIDSSTGELTGIKEMLEVSSECKYQIKATQGSATQITDFITVTGSSEITYNYSKPSLTVQKGGTLEQVQLQFSEPLPFKVNLEYEYYNNQGTHPPFLGYSLNGTIELEKEASHYNLEFTIPSSVTYSGTAYFGFKIKDLKPEPGMGFLDLRTYETKKTYIKISSGREHTCAIETSGELYCWGRNLYGQIGKGVSGSAHTTSTPVQVGSSNTWTDVSAGFYHTCGINNNELYCWGYDQYGQVGNGSASSTNVLVPEKIGILNNWTDISAGHEFTCGINNNELYCWGRDNTGQIGNGSASSTNVTAPEKIGISNMWMSVDAGENHVCGINNSLLVCWGLDLYGQIGNGSASTSIVTTPEVIGGLNSWTQISAAYDHTCGINNNELYCWGRDSDGQIGNGSLSSSNVEAPEKIGTFNSWSKISSGESFNCGLNANQLYCWGKDNFGQLGNGNHNYADISEPTQITEFSDWSDLDSGLAHTCAIRNQNLYCWGYNNYSQLGNNIDSSPTIHTPTKNNNYNNWSHITSGGFHTCALKNNELFCWGFNSDGQVGNNSSSFEDVLAPEKIGYSNSWQMIDAGAYHTCGINSGELFCWGYNSYGQIGNGNASINRINIPTKVGTSNLWSDISLGENHTCGINNGELYCWGIDSDGQTGNGSGSTTSVTSPEKIGSLNNWTSLAAGDNHTCGINNGELYCWGYNIYGRVGNGISTSTVHSPEKIGSLSSWSKLSAGYSHTCGINNGELFCWGANYSGQLGNGGTTGSTVPEKIGSSNTWTHITAGGDFTCGIDSGELFCWGVDDNGQMGNGSELTNDITSPNKIGISNLWTAVSAGYSHNCAINNDEIYCFGLNTNSQSVYRFPNEIPTINIE